MIASDCIDKIYARVVVKKSLSVCGGGARVIQSWAIAVLVTTCEY